MISRTEKQLWVDALRSGEFEQAIGAYVTNDGKKCAVGVLGAVVSGSREFYTVLAATEDYTKAIGKKSLPGEFLNAIFGMNDNGSTFSEIADYIDANLGVTVVEKELVAV
jgi:hypothetical protein